MDDGIYSVSLTSRDEPVGEGIVVVNNGTMNGAGSGYLWTGFYDQENELISCEIRVHNESKASIFAEKESYILKLEHRPVGELVYSGSVPNDPLRTVSAELVWLGCLAR